jgi:hypothetical protein
LTNAESEEELMEYTRKGPEFRAAMETLARVSAEPSVRYMAEFREKARRDEYARMKYAIQEATAPYEAQHAEDQRRIAEDQQRIVDQAAEIAELEQQLASRG